MNTATYFEHDTTNIKAIFFSIALHVFIVLCVIYGFTIAPVHFTQQQMIQVMLVSVPSAENSKPKTEVTKESTPKTELLVKPKPVKKEKPENPILKSELIKVNENKVQENDFSEPQISAGTPSHVKESPQILVTEPVYDAAYLNNPVPEYPSHAKRWKMQGTVRLAVSVSADGNAKSVEVAESSGFAILDASAKKAVSGWKFIPAKRGNQPVESNVIVPLTFGLI